MKAVLVIGTGLVGGADGGQWRTLPTTAIHAHCGRARLPIRFWARALVFIVDTKVT